VLKLQERFVKVGLNITDDKVISGQELDILYSKGEIEFDECRFKI